MNLSNILSFLKSDSVESTMRVNVTLMGLSSTILLLSIGFNIIYNTINRLPIAWETQGIFIGGITALMTGVLWQKTAQKKVEMGTPIPDTNTTIITN